MELEAIMDGLNKEQRAEMMNIVKELEGYLDEETIKYCAHIVNEYFDKGCHDSIFKVAQITKDKDKVRKFGNFMNTKSYRFEIKSVVKALEANAENPDFETLIGIADKNYTKLNFSYVPEAAAISQEYSSFVIDNIDKEGINFVARALCSSKGQTEEDQQSVFDLLKENMNRDDIIVFASNISRIAGFSSPGILGEFIDYVKKHEDCKDISTVARARYEIGFWNSNVKNYKEFLEEYIDHKDIGSIASGLVRIAQQHKEHPKAVMNTIELVKKNNDNPDIKYAVIALSNSVQGDNLGNFVDMYKIIEKYLDNNLKVVCEAIEDADSKLGLMSDKAYNAIKNSSNPKETTEKIASINYHIFEEKIEDVELRDNASYELLDEITSVHWLIEDIHDKRNEIHKKEIIDGFYSEMNRAISQGYDLKSKVGLLKQYCAEAKRKMMDEALDLMVMHNA